MPPIFALVGKPNVGKSTLFNRMTRSRAALVDATPGLTRDRQYGQCTYQNYSYSIIDTGGISGAKVGLAPAINEQTFIGIQEADAIILVVDGRLGVSAEDYLIIKQLRLTAKPIILVINKTEGLNQNTTLLNDFYDLGLGTGFPISATHGTGIEQLLDYLSNQYPANPQQELTPEEKCINFEVLGRPNVGKSTLVNHILGFNRMLVSDLDGTTRDSIKIKFTHHNQTYNIIDTAGIRRRKNIVEISEKISIAKGLHLMHNVDVIVLVVNVQELFTEQDLRLLRLILESGKALVIAVNKWDQIPLMQHQEIHEEIKRKLSFLTATRIEYISALTGLNVMQLMTHIQEAYHAAQQKFTTAALNAILSKATQRNHPPIIAGKKIKLRYAHLGGNNPPIIVIHGNNAIQLPENYKRYLANFYQTELKIMGAHFQIKFKNNN